MSKTIFVSHATKDDTTVDLIYDALQAAGFVPWVDHREGITYGDLWSRNIHEAVKKCEIGLFVMSENSVKSVYCDAEWNRIIQLGKTLYVVQIDPVPQWADVPLLIGMIQFTNLAQEFDANLQRLIAVMQGKTDTQPDAPKPSTRRITGLEMMHDTLPLLRTVPLCGRDADVEKIKAHLAQKPTLIVGLGGLGKSRLAAEIVLHHAQGALWHRCTETSAALNVIEALRQHYGLPPSADRPDVLQTMAQKPCLVVLDNAESIEQDAPRRREYMQLARDLHLHQAQVLITSRVDYPELTPRHSYPPQTLPLETATQLALDMAEAIGIRDRVETIAAETAEKAHNHPRLIEWAMGQMAHRDPHNILKQLAELKHKNVQAALDEMIYKTVRQMVDSTPEGAAAEKILQKLVVFRGGFTFEAALAVVNTSPLDNVGANAKIDEDTLYDLLAVLSTWRFVQYDSASKRYSMGEVVTAAIPADAAALDAHFDYYKALARQHHKKQDYLGLDIETANLDIAFERACDQAAWEKAYWFANACHGFLANRGRFEQCKNWLETVAMAFGVMPSPVGARTIAPNIPASASPITDELRAAIQNDLGIIYWQMPTGDRRDNLQRAIDAYQQALLYRTPDAAPREYAATQHNLGTAYRDLAQLEDRRDNLQRAIDAYQQALLYLTPDAAPREYAMTQNNLGTAYRDLAQLEDRRDNLQRAIDAFQQALKHDTPDAAPLEYAATQNNLGLVYSDLAQLEDPAGNLQRAIDAYQQALLYRTPDAAPLDYARTQNNLGLVYSALAQLEDPAGNLQRAIDAFQQALLYRTPDAAPREYAMTQHNLGLVYSDLAQLEDRKGNLQRAIDAFQQALLYRTPDAAPREYATTQHNLGNAYRDLAQLEDPAGNLQRAIDAYQQALLYLTPNAAPREYAATQAILGIAYKDLGDMAKAIECWREAEKYFRQMGYVEYADMVKGWIEAAEQEDEADSDGDGETDEDDVL